MLNQSFSDETFPCIQPEPHLVQLKTIFPLAYFYLPDRRGDLHLSTITSLEEICSQDTNLQRYFTDYGLILQTVKHLKMRYTQPLYHSLTFTKTEDAHYFVE